MNNSESDTKSKLYVGKKFSEYILYDGKKLTPILLKLGIEALIATFISLLFALIFLLSFQKLRDNEILINDLIIVISGIILCFISIAIIFISLLLVFLKMKKMNQSEAQELLNSLSVKTLDLYLFIIGLTVTLIGFILFFVHFF